MNELIIKIKNYCKNYFNENGDNPTFEDIKNKLNLTYKKLYNVLEIIDKTYELISLDEINNDTYGNNNINIEDEIVNIQKRDDVMKFINTINLTNNEKKVLLQSFGFITNVTPPAYKRGNKTNQTKQKVLKKFQKRKEKDELKIYMDLNI